MTAYQRPADSSVCALAIAAVILLAGWRGASAAELTEVQRRSASDGDLPAAAGAAPAELSRSDLAEALEKLSSKQLGGGGAAAVEKAQRPADRLGALLAALGRTRDDAEERRYLSNPPRYLSNAARTEERRFFSNAGGRGKKEEGAAEAAEAAVAPPAAAVSTDRLYEAVRELTGFVRDFVELYKEQREETENTLSTLTQIVEKLVSYHTQ